ncbi:hypothetical protein [Microlunatus parietis]|uniref:Uncharacterized protein YbbC (DUF1343 family) n=1 Tax=Microlunatus parietis TaxID=682979 RepID=A0A7Y9LFL4_9ACTN|nr:hypothetical protein [Microlunatus parietis]NYE74251.1 uncharacterized protein YbbC (DUF1343 family) [Microlunatus parietis]
MYAAHNTETHYITVYADGGQIEGAFTDADYVGSTVTLSEHIARYGYEVGEWFKINSKTYAADAAPTKVGESDTSGE